MKKTKQLTLFPNKTKKFFGGALLYKKRKSKRPLSSKDAIHLVLRSGWAMGKDSFLTKRHQHVIKQILLRFSKMFGVRIYQQSINSNHVHLLLRITNRQLYTAFIKAVSGQIASQVMGQQSFAAFALARAKSTAALALARKTSTAGDGVRSSVKSANHRATNGAALTLEKSADLHQTPEGFWQFRPFSRIVSWGRDFKSAVGYLKRNILEAFGFVNYKPRKDHYSAWIKHAAPVLSTG